jgi:hypothetical protein
MWTYQNIDLKAPHLPDVIERVPNDTIVMWRRAFKNKVGVGWYIVHDSPTFFLMVYDHPEDRRILVAVKRVE